MSGWFADYGRDESWIRFESEYYEKVKAVEKVCCAIIDKEVSCPDDIEVVVRCKDCCYKRPYMGLCVCKITNTTKKPDGFCDKGHKDGEYRWIENNA